MKNNWPLTILSVCMLLLFSTTASASVMRHELELQAVNQPEAVLTALPEKIQAANTARDWQTLSLLHLAHANACRVLADWTCQREAAQRAGQFAQQAKMPELNIRALIGQSRAEGALQDFAQAERLLAKAEALLQSARNDDLLAEVMLAYSSISYQLGRFQASLNYTEKGLKLFAKDPNQHPANSDSHTARDKGTRIRLLRNKARAQIELAQPQPARETLKQAIALNIEADDFKLAGELYLETARLDRQLKNLDQQLISTAKVVEIAKNLSNSQLKGQALEIEGLTLKDSDREREAFVVLSKAYASFEALNLRRDALRVLQELLPLAIRQKASSDVVSRLTLELVTLQRRIDKEDKTLASANFDARLQYAKQEFELQQLSREKQVLQSNEALFKKNRNLALLAAGLATLFSVAAFVFAYLQRRARIRLHDSQQKLLAITENIPAEIAQLNRNYEFQFVNTRGAALTGKQRSELIGTSLLNLSPILAPQRKLMADRAIAGETVRFEESKLSMDADSRESTTTYEVVFVPDFATTPDAMNQTKGFFALRFDISRLKQAEFELAKMAEQDSLTGLSNRRHFTQLVEKAIERANADRSNLSLLTIDLDQFKQVNDSHGHLVGDAVLRHVAKAISDSIRQSDAAGRIGGDEFMVLLERTPNVDVAQHIAEKIRLQANQELTVLNTAVRISVSIGISHGANFHDVNALIAPADSALFEAKRAGRNRVLANQV